MVTVSTHWNVPYRFKGAKILHDSTSWADGHRLMDLLKNKPLSFRLGRRSKYFFGADRVQFEKDCLHVQCTMKEFLQWTRKESIVSDDHPLKNFSSEEYFAYADYMHLPELLNNEQDPLIRMIDWSQIGLNNRDGNQSTLWIGSQASHTPCHYDTYGINFVAQIVGRKRWLLFPPNSPLGELQTRIPYEESSVYLDIEPTLMKKYQNIDVFDVILEPGDVLFVPKHWWHFVSSLDALTISINSWIEQSDDQQERIKEMLVRQMITSSIFAHDCSPDQWLNHNEVTTDPMTNLTILSSLLNPSDSNEIQEPAAKRSVNVVPADHVEEQRLTSIAFGQLEFFPQLESINSNSSASNSSDDDRLLRRLLRAMTSRESVDLIYEKLLRMS